MHGAALREQRAGVAEKIMLAQELIERFIIETERRAVDPHEVRALQIAVCNTRAVYVDELAEVLVVFVDKVDDFCKPTFALRVAETAASRPSAPADGVKCCCKILWNFVLSSSSGITIFEVWSVARLNVLLGAVQTRYFGSASLQAFANATCL